MIVLLQHVTTSLYLKQIGVWTANSDIAVNFRYAEHAITFARANRLTDVHVLIAFRESEFAHIIRFSTQTLVSGDACANHSSCFQSGTKSSPRLNSGRR